MHMRIPFKNDPTGKSRKPISTMIVRGIVKKIAGVIRSGEVCLEAVKMGAMAA